MTDYLSFTATQLEEQIKVLKNYYFSVRVFDEQHISNILQGRNDGNGPLPFKCYEVWKRNEPCRRCVSCISYLTKRDASKLEELDGNIYEATSKYILVDGVPHILELVKKFDQNFIDDIKKGNVFSNGGETYYKRIYIDALTGAYNRRFYEEKLRNKIVTTHIAMLDIDDFKLYNDIFGHHTGDEVLIDLVKAVRTCLGKNDIVIRLGGDEFALFFATADDKQFEEYLNRIKKSINDIKLAGVPLEISIGGASCNNEMVSSALHKADCLMYEAKKLGNSVFVDSKRNIQSEVKKDSILLYDDREQNRNFLSSLLENTYMVRPVSTKEEFLQELEKKPSLALLRLSLNGSLSLIDKTNELNVPCIITIEKDDDKKKIETAFELGASDYLTEPLDAKNVFHRVKTTIEINFRKNRLLTLVKKG